MIERERWERVLLVGVAVFSILASFWTFSRQYYVPAHAGTDQNGYLVSGKMMASHFSRAITPDDPYSFVGRMWVASNDGRYVPKYPPGYSILIAIFHTFGGAHAAYLINPLCMLLALLAVFLIVRQVAGSFAGLLGIVMIASSPVTLALTNNPNSHASALCLVTWGMYLLLRWWERGAFWRAALAGALLGFATTVRYSEALLFLPLLLSSCFNLHWRRGESWAQAGTLIGCWASPILLMLVCNHLTTGTWTGYDLTNESSAGFSWENFANHWEMMLRQFAGTGLFFTLPIGVLGLILLFARNWQLALVLWAWLLPPVLLYAGYYWAWPADQGGIGSLRFLLTVFPPVAIGAGWCLTRLVPTAPYSNWILRWIVAPAAALLIVLGAAALNVVAAQPMLENDQHKSQAVQQAADEIISHAKVPPDAVVFGPQEFLNHLQFITDFRLYDTSELDPSHILSLNQVKADQPGGLEPKRAKALYDLLRANRKEEEFKKQLPADLAKLMRQLTTKALEEGRRVYLIVPRDAAPPLKFTDATYNQSDHTSLSTRKAASWTEPAITPASGRHASAGAPVQLPRAAWDLLEITRSAR
jgi:hypothetical protein